MSAKASEIVLLSLTLRNFKGIREFTLDTQGGNVDVFGNNATGKTTLFDAFTWLWFDKDSQNKAEPQRWIKTLNDGNPISGLEHEVEGEILINGRRRTFRKVFTEKWTKKRGSATAEFTGHETEYFIDGAPKKKGEYEKYIAEIVGEEVFKLLTNPSYFNEVYNKDKRRRVLLDICGDISDAEVLSSNSELSGLLNYLDGRTIDEHRDKVKADQKRINDELKMIPVRIDESNRAIPDTEGLSEADVTNRLAALQAQIQDKQSELLRIQSGSQITAKEKLRLEIEGELQRIKNRVEADSLQRVTTKRQEIAAMNRQLEDIKLDIGSNEKRIKLNKASIAQHEETANKLRAQFAQVQAETLEHHEHSDDCPSCGQKLPVEKLAEALAKASEAFNQAKSERLESIRTKGKGEMTQAERLAQENDALEKELANLRNHQTAVEGRITTARSELERQQEDVKDASQDLEYINKRRELDGVISDLSQLQLSAIKASETVRGELVILKEQTSQLEQDKAKFSQIKMIRQRIEELKKREKELATMYEQLEQQLFLTEEFTRTKVSMLESRINSKFKFARFRLFEQQVNGALKEDCETLYGPNLVPYSNGLNRAAQTNVGLDIINTLSEHYGIKAPIFIDNAEAVTQLEKTAGQQIRLVVSASDKKLRVEAINEQIQEAI